MLKSPRGIPTGAVIRHLKHHAMHLLMCAPMLLIAVIAIAAGAGAGALLPAVLSMAMMAMMIGGAHGHRGGQSRAAEATRWLSRASTARRCAAGRALRPCRTP